tara:strand:+ start:2375 stop:2731 length:357 start_codon:yes stop_codon:yes gene_type:complete
MKKVIFEAGINKVGTLSDGTMSINLHTQELSADTMTRIFEMNKKPGLVLISSDSISQEEIDAVQVATKDFEFNEKTPSQRLRNVLYRVWEQTDQQKDFRLFYEIHMEKVINQYKSTLD